MFNIAWHSLTKNNLNRNTFGLGYFSFFIGFSVLGVALLFLGIYLLTAFMPRKTIDMSEGFPEAKNELWGFTRRGCGRLFHAKRQNKNPAGVDVLALSSLTSTPLRGSCQLFRGINATRLR